METDVDIEDEEKLWKIAENLCKKFNHLGNECVFLCFGKDIVQSHGTRIGNEFLTSYPDWADRFRNFCAASCGTNTEDDKHPCMLIISLDACDEKNALTEEQKRNNPVNNSDMEIEKNYTDDCNTEDKNKTGEIPSHHFKKIKSEKEKDMKKKRSKKTKLLPVCNKIKDGGNMLTGSRKTSTMGVKASEKRSVELENFVEEIKTSSCSKSNKVTVKDCRNVCKKLSKKLMFNKTVSKNKKQTDDTESKDERKIDCKVSKQRGGKSYIDRGDNKIELLTNSSETKEESGYHDKKNTRSKTRLSEEARYSKLHPDLQELWTYLNRLNYECKLCSKEYDNNISYYNHIRSHKDFEHCKICDVFIPKGRENIEIHKAEKHINDLHFKCYRCGRHYKSKLGLKSHFIVNHADEVVRFKCKICNAQTGTQAMLTRHQHIHKFENSCFICLEKIDTKEKLKEHMKDVHHYYICTFCSSYFVDHVEVEEHEKTHLHTEAELDILDTNTTSISDIIDTNSTSVKESTIISTCSSTNEKEELRTFEMGTKSCEVKLKGKDAGNYSLNADNTEANIEVKREDTNIDNLDGIDRYFTEKAAKIDKECHIKEQNGKSNSTDDSLEMSVKNCKFCGKHFTHANALLRHMKLHNNKSNFTCEHCGKICKTDETFKRHMILHLPNEDKPFKCNVCGKGFPTRTNLNIHSVVHNSINQYICEYCGKGYRDPRQLKIHNRTHTGELPYQCNECHRKFRSWDTLDNHKITHKPKTVICDICGKVFSHRLRLAAHKKSHDAIGQHKCLFDDSRFKSASNLHAHYIAKHVEYAKKQGWLMHTCEHCGKQLATKEKYRRHVRTHTGEKPFKCTLCEKRFAEKGNLNAHMKIHKNDRPFRCSYCNKGFIHNRTLKRHVLIHKEMSNSQQDKNIKEKNPQKYKTYTKDQLLAISLVARTENYVEVSQEEATTRSQTFSTPNENYVLHLPANHLQQALDQSTKYKSLLPVKITDNRVSVTSVPHADHDYLTPELAPVEPVPEVNVSTTKSDLSIHLFTDQQGLIEIAPIVQDVDGLGQAQEMLDQNTEQLR